MGARQYLRSAPNIISTTIVRRIHTDYGGQIMLTSESEIFRRGASVSKSGLLRHPRFGMRRQWSGAHAVLARSCCAIVASLLVLAASAACSQQPAPAAAGTGQQGRSAGGGMA